MLQEQVNTPNFLTSTIKISSIKRSAMVSSSRIWLQAIPEEHRLQLLFLYTLMQKNARGRSCDETWNLAQNQIGYPPINSIAPFSNVIFGVRVLSPNLTKKARWPKILNLSMFIILLTTAKSGWPIPTIPQILDPCVHSLKPLYSHTSDSTPQMFPYHQNCRC